VSKFLSLLSIAAIWLATQAVMMLALDKRSRGATRALAFDQAASPRRTGKER
jgi:hypothetical protein